jgi:hypothetical protein
MPIKRIAMALLVALALASTLAVLGPPIDWCQAEWVKDSAFWRWYFNCGTDSDGGGESVAL